MKRSLAMVLALALAFTLTACGEPAETEEVKTPAPTLASAEVEENVIDYSSVSACFAEAYLDAEVSCSDNNGTPLVIVSTSLASDAQPENWAEMQETFSACLIDSETAAKEIGCKTAMGQLLAEDSTILLSGFNGKIQYDAFAKKEPLQNGDSQTEHPLIPKIERVQNETMGQKNAIKSAESYLKHSYFSYNGLIEQLEYEKYSKEDATYAADCCGADWYDQAEGQAKQYLKHSNFSYSGLVEQLEYEGFTNGQATWGADHCDANWYDQAAGKAASYLKHSSFSKDGLIEQLEYEGFTHSEAVYGAEQNGY